MPFKFRFINRNHLGNSPLSFSPCGPWEPLIYWLRGRNLALRGAQKLAYLHDMSRFLCSVRLVFRSAR